MVRLRPAFFYSSLVYGWAESPLYPYMFFSILLGNHLPDQPVAAKDKNKIDGHLRNCNMRNE